MNKLKEENSKLEFVYYSKLLIEMLPYLILVLALSQQSNKLKDSFKWVMFLQKHILILFVIIYLKLALIKVPGW